MSFVAQESPQLHPLQPFQSSNDHNTNHLSLKQHHVELKFAHHLLKLTRPDRASHLLADQVKTARSGDILKPDLLWRAARSDIMHKMCVFVQLPLLPSSSTRSLQPDHRPAGTPIQAPGMSSFISHHHPRPPITACRLRYLITPIYCFFLTIKPSPKNSDAFLRRFTHKIRTQTPPATRPPSLPNSLVAKGQREAALRERGLLPPLRDPDDVVTPTEPLVEKSDHKTPASQIKQEWEARNAMAQPTVSLRRTNHASSVDKLTNNTVTRPSRPKW